MRYGSSSLPSPAAHIAVRAIGAIAELIEMITGRSPPAAAFIDEAVARGLHRQAHEAGKPAAYPPMVAAEAELALGEDDSG